MFYSTTIMTYKQKTKRKSIVYEQTTLSNIGTSRNIFLKLSHTRIKILVFTKNGTKFYSITIDWVCYRN